MLLKYFYDDYLAQASYLVGCERAREALVVDPARNIQPYLAMAEREGLRITQVAETHIHADFVSGARELSAAAGATIYLSAEGGADWQYAYADAPNVCLVRDGDAWRLGGVRVEALHTPGHTPEHIAFMVTDTVGANRPMGIFSGDFIFVGDVGRPDLLEAAAGQVGTKEIGARQQFASIQRVKAMPDYLQVWPGHGAGSACGKALGALPSTTLGYEKLFNPAFQFEDEASFSAWLLDGQPPAPRYFAQMKRVNKAGAVLLSELAPPPMLGTAELEAALTNGEQIFDLRPRETFARGQAAGLISVPMSSLNFSTYLGSLVDFAQPIYLVVEDEAALAHALPPLRAIGVDWIAGVFTSGELQNLSVFPTMTASELAGEFARVVVLDVRAGSEYDEEHIVGALHIPLGDLPRKLDDLPRDKPLVTQCAGGYRAQVAASWLRAQGFSNVISLADGKELWSKVVPVETKGRH